ECALRGSVPVSRARPRGLRGSESSILIARHAVSYPKIWAPTTGRPPARSSSQAQARDSSHSRGPRELICVINTALGRSLTVCAVRADGGIVILSSLVLLSPLSFRAKSRNL